MPKIDKFKRAAGLAFGGSTPARETHAPEEPPVNGLESTKRLLGARMVPLSLIQADPNQPRRTFATGSLDELAASIRAHGILQPLLVTADAEGAGYRIVAGERRFRAAALAGLDAVPCIVSSGTEDAARREKQLIENIQRESLSPLEECDAFVELQQQYGLTHQEIAERVGKSRTYITKTMSLRRIPSDIRAELATTEGASREVLILLSQQPTEESARQLYDSVKLGSTVREARKTATRARRQPSGPQLRRFVVSAPRNGAEVTIAFKRPVEDSRAAIRALEEALEHLRTSSE